MISGYRWFTLDAIIVLYAKNFCHSCIQQVQAKNQPFPTCRKDNFEFSKQEPGTLPQGTSCFMHTQQGWLRVDREAENITASLE